MYKVSIVIPVYNVELYIKETLMSALDQTFKSIEYIIVDDCGQDNSMNIIREILKDHPRKKDVYIYTHLKNKGLSVARNTGLQKARGEYVFFMDSDDAITQDCIEKHYDRIVNVDADFTIANIKLVGVDASVHIPTLQMGEKKDQEILKSFLMREWNVSACNKLYKRLFLELTDVKFTPNLLHEDIIWSYRLSKMASRVVAISDSTYIYKIRENSITRSLNSNSKIESLFYILNIISKDYNDVFATTNIVKEYFGYLTILRFNIALMLLNSPVSLLRRCEFYRALNTDYLRSLEKKNVFAFLLRLPFGLFFLLLKIPYFIYKNKQLCRFLKIKFF